MPGTARLPQQLTSRLACVQVPFEMRVQQAADAPQEVGTLEAVKVHHAPPPHAAPHLLLVALASISEPPLGR